MAEKLKKNSSLFSAFLMVLAALIWGTSFVAQSKGLDKIGNFTFLSFRSYLAVLALIPVALFFYKNGKKSGDGAHGEYKSFFSKRLVFGGVLCGIFLFAGTAFQQIGIKYSGVGKSGFLTTLYILIVPLIGLLFKRKVKPTLWGCIAIALLGMYFLCAGGAGGISFGDIMLIFCALGFAIQITTVDRFISTVDGVRLSLVQFITCSVLSTVTMLIFEEVDMSVILDAWFPVFYAGVMSSGAAFTLQIISQKNLNPVVASLLMSLESVFAALSGAAFGERLSSREIIGCCLVFAAIIISQLPLEKIFKKKEIKE